MIPSSYYIFHKNGDKNWYIYHGIKHRTGAAAEERRSGTTRWFKQGMLHREDGPATYYPILDITMWALKGKIYTSEEDYRDALKQLQNNR